jgi:outer membrane protein insertion porin family
MGGDGLMKCQSVRVAMAVLAAVFATQSGLHAQPGTIEDIQVVGLVRMTDEAFARAFGLEKGDPYDVRRIQAQFRRLWDLGVFEDVSVEAEDGPGGGKVLIVKVRERKILSSVTYEDNKVLNRTAIEDGLKERKVRLELGKPLDMKVVFDAAQTIRDLLGAKGYLDPVVTTRLEAATQSSVGVFFVIKPGAKTKIRDIEFVGNTVFSDRQLARSLKLTKPWRWYWPFSSKALYFPAKWDADAGTLSDLYKNLGYLDVEVRPPVVEIREKVRSRGEGEAREEPEPAAGDAAGLVSESVPAPAAPSPDETKKEEKRRKKAEKKAAKEEKKQQPRVKRWAYLTVEVVEGPQYRVGDVSVSGNKVYEDDRILAGVLLRKDQIFNKGLLDASIKRIQAAYENRGHAYATVRQETTRRPGENVADIRLIVNEDKPYYISRIEFTGNTSTQDRVLRREFQIAEGDLFSRDLLDLSLAKVTQLGYFEAKKEDMVVEPIEGTDKVTVTVPGEEKGRNEIQIGGGYSGVDGAFFTGFYSTRNLLGRGQILSVSLQIGGRANRYVLSFQEPWFLGRPYLFGASIFKRDVDYGSNQRSTSEGAGLALGRRVGVFGSVGVRYDLQRVRSTGFTFDGREAENRIASLTPTYSWNKINDPYRPSRGWSLGFDFTIAGGPLRGDTNYLRPRLLYTGYLPAFKRGFFGLHAELGYIRPWQGGSSDNTANVEGIPRFERFWLGGDTLGPRIFETRSVTPLRFIRLDEYGRIIETTVDPRGRPASDFDRNGDGVLNRLDLVDVGGNRSVLLQAEYVLPVAGPFELAFFLDAANVWFEGASLGFDELRASAGIEARFYIPVFPVPLRLIYGVPVRDLPEDRTSGFTFSIGRSF